MRARGAGNDTAASSVSRSTFAILQVDLDEASSSESSQAYSSPKNPTILPTKPGCIAAAPQVQELMRRFADHAYTSYMQGTPALSHLSLLLKYNVSSALQRNADILSVKAEYFECEGLSPFPSREHPSNLIYVPQANDWSVSLLPMRLQCSIEHHPWVDVFPWPRFRDNMLQGFQDPDICDEDDLCREVVEYEDLGSKPLLIVWGDA